MSGGVLDIAPPDDSGSDTFRRYRYQAEIAFPFCLDCALVGNVVSVVPEHLKDLAVQYVDGSWRLIQIKTRDPGQGPWTWAVLIASDGGALKSFLRTHRALAGYSGAVSYELRLEGSLKHGDLAERLKPGGDGPNDEMIQSLAQRLEIEADEAGSILALLTIRDGQPSRENVEAMNVRKLGLGAQSTPAGIIETVYGEVIRKIEAAMDRRLAEAEWPRAVVDDSVRGDEDVLRQKVLNKEVLDPLFGGLTSTQPILLRQIANPDAQTSILEDKLAAWGANPEVIQNAKLLRANASIRTLELAASSISGTGEVFEDLRIRLLVVANAAAAAVGGTNSANQVWAELQSRLNDQRETVDQHNLMRRDPMLLLGEVCELSDLCEYGWGRPNA